MPRGTGRTKYPSLERRLKAEQERNEKKARKAARKKQREAAAAAKELSAANILKSGGPEPAPIPALPPTPENSAIPEPSSEPGVGTKLKNKVKAEAAIDEADLAAAALEAFVEKYDPASTVNTVDPEARGVIATYLQPYIDRLQKHEKAIGDFPHNSTVAWHDIEAQVLDVKDTRSLKKIAEGEGVSPELMYSMSKNRRWKQRSAILKELHARRTTCLALADHGALLHGKMPGAGLPADLQDEHQLKSLVGDCITVYKDLLKAGVVEFKGARDLDILVRLLSFVQGKADKIEEKRHRITVEDLMVAAKKTAKRHQWSAASAGVVQDADFVVVGESDEDEGGEGERRSA